MRILVLGGTAFLSREVAVAAVGAGHAVTCAARGVSGDAPAGVRFVRWDRSAATMPPELADESFDAVVDVAGTPSWVRRAATEITAAHWVFVSTISVYADPSIPGGDPSNLAVLPPLDRDEPFTTPDEYGAMKVACEEAVLTAHPHATVVRPGLIVGPGDPTGRFSYWPARLSAASDGEAVVAPGSPDDRVQLVDVRDLAGWIVRLAERRTGGRYDAVGPAAPMSVLLQDIAIGVGVQPRWVWVSDELLRTRGVPPWSGPGALPLWLPRPEFSGMLDHDASSARPRDWSSGRSSTPPVTPRRGCAAPSMRRSRAWTARGRRR